jgi:hypothetical protein
MASFSDQTGRVWQVVISPYEYRKLKNQLDLDLYDVVDAEKMKAIISRLESDDCLLAEALWLICEDDAKAQGIGRRDFERALQGEALNQGWLAILEAQTDFFKRPEQREVARKLLEFVRAVNQRMEPIVSRISERDVQQAAKTFVDSVTNLLEASESTPNQPIETDDGATRLVNCN